MYMYPIACHLAVELQCSMYSTTMIRSTVAEIWNLSVFVFLVPVPTTVLEYSVLYKYVIPWYYSTTVLLTGRGSTSTYATV